jgi:hypothetical protein
VYQFYMGRRGVLYWLSQAAWYGSIALAGAWILFRWALWWGAEGDAKQYVG